MFKSGNSAIAIRGAAMKDELLHYYQQELNNLQQTGAEFAKRYPKLAGHLQNPEQSDPHFARLIEAVAFMNAQVKQKLDDEFSLFSDGLFDILQPAYHQPLPAMVIAQFKPQPDLTQPFTIPRHTPIEMLVNQTDPVRFQTCYDITLLPAEVTQAELLPHCETAPALANPSAAGCLHLTLHCIDSDQTFAQLAPKTLRFFLRSNQALSFALYDMLFRHTQAISLAAEASSQTARFLNSKQLHPLGFTEQQMILPYNARQPIATQLLVEYFAYPEKFLFIEIAQLEPIDWKGIGNELHLYFYLQQVPQNLTKVINADLFTLGCTPLINLYPKLAEPLTVHGQSDEYTVIPDIRQAIQHEIYTITQVTGTNEEDHTTHYLPLFSLDQHGYHQGQGYWQARRHPELLHSRVTIRLTDINGQPIMAVPQVLQIATLCFNPTIQAIWQQTDGCPKLQLTQSSAPVTDIHAITRPCKIIRPQLTKGTHWRLVSALSLAHLTVTQDQGAALREVLQLYNVNPTEQNRIIIQSIQNLQTQHITLKLSTPGQLSFCQGLAITLTLDEQPFAGNSVWLFCHLLAHFLALQATINSFVQLRVISATDQRQLYVGSPLMGQLTLL